jgi:hypothetical protein
LESITKITIADNFLVTHKNLDNIDQNDIAARNIDTFHYMNSYQNEDTLYILASINNGGSVVFES